MLALRLHGKQDMRVDDVEIPLRGLGDVLVRVRAAAVCGSDYRTFTTGTSGHGLALPRTMGHEIYGVIEDLDSETQRDTGLVKGDSVIVGAIAPCGSCRYCVRGQSNMCVQRAVLGYQYDGGFASYVVAPRKLVACGNLIKAPESAVAAEHLALAEPLSCVVNAQTISAIGMGDAVVIIGAGPLGLLHTQVARLRGASLVIMIEEISSRRRIAADLGADYVLEGGSGSVAEVFRITGGYGADVVIVAAPSPEAVHLALDLLAKHGRLNIFGGMPKGQEVLPLDANRIHYAELTVQGTSDSAPSHLWLATDLIARRLVDMRPIVTDVIDLSAGTRVFTERNPAQTIKAVLVPRA